MIQFQENAQTNGGTEVCVTPYTVSLFSSGTNNEYVNNLWSFSLHSVSIYSNINQTVTGINNCYNYRLLTCAGTGINSNIADILG